MSDSKTFALKGNICYSLDQTRLAVMEQAYVICENGLCAGVPVQIQEILLSFPD